MPYFHSHHYEQRNRQMVDSVDELRALQESGRIPPDLDPACLLVMLMGAAMATTVLPQVVEGVCGTAADSTEFLTHYADQVAALGRAIGLDST